MYQPLARKWRPQRFEDVIGQRGVTQTLRNATAAGRIGQAFVFAGPRGVGKTTTARILARALNCTKGPTPDPCGVCEACVEIAGGRSLDVLEIDAATHTQVDNVREVIISGLSIPPVRDRYKIFVIDEVHQLSSHSFNALLKSIEEPPPHVVFMMATTELERIPDTILSRAQVFEFRTIGARAIADQLRRIADAEGIAVEDGALTTIARAAEGSMRDAQSALDQVIAFAGERVTAADVAAVLGLVGRDLLLEMAAAVADENAAAVFDLAGRAVEAGQDLRLVCRELTRLVRDLLVVSIDPARLQDVEIAPEGERDRLKSLAARFSREDLMRAFDVLSRAEEEVRTAAQPRYHLEMALLRWIQLGKLVPLEEVIEGLRKGTLPPVRPKPEATPHVRPKPDAPPPSEPKPPGAATPSPVTDLKDAFLAEVRQNKKVLYGTVIAMAQQIEVAGDRITFMFTPVQRALQMQLEQSRPWLEEVASRLAGRTMTVTTVNVAQTASAPEAAPAVDPEESRKAQLKARAMTDSGVQALLDVFPAEIRDVEEM
jgi:DNA polymerase-3 subunit gamma/tau